MRVLFGCSRSSPRALEGFLQLFVKLIRVCFEDVAGVPLFAHWDQDSVRAQVWPTSLGCRWNV